jgi:hypothetical protein
MTDIIAHKPATPFAMDTVRITEARSGLDTARQRFWAPSSSYITEDQAHPGLAGFITEDVDIDGSEAEGYEYDVMSKGLRGGKHRRVDGYPRPEDKLNDFDTETDQWLTTNPEHFVRGAYYNGKVCVSRAREKLHDKLSVYRVTAQLVGLGGGSRRVQRTISCNGQQISREQLKVQLERGWSDYRKGVVSIPKVVVVDTYLSSAPPPTSNIPGTSMPLAAPPVRNMNLTGPDLTYYWPHGWTYTVSGQQPFGAEVSLWRNEYIYE